MSENIQKRSLNQMNKYQQKVLLLSLLPCTVLCLCMTTLLYVFFNDFGNALSNEETILDLAYVKYWGMLVMGILWAFFIGLLLWVYREANSLVGAFDRVKRELYDVSMGNRRESIIVRESDQLFKELLDQINAIIQKLYDRP